MCTAEGRDSLFSIPAAARQLSNRREIGFCLTRIVVHCEYLLLARLRVECADDNGTTELEVNLCLTCSTRSGQFRWGKIRDFFYLLVVISSRKLLSAQLFLCGGFIFYMFLKFVFNSPFVSRWYYKRSCYVVTHLFAFFLRGNFLYGNYWFYKVGLFIFIILYILTFSYCLISMESSKFYTLKK